MFNSVIHASMTEIVGRRREELEQLQGDVTGYSN
jgi:hypothetical protein